MDNNTRALMSYVFDKLSDDAKGDIESQFENLAVLWERMLEEERENKHNGHRPALELHIGEITADIFDGINYCLTTGRGDHIRPMIFDMIKCAVLFGKHIGEVKWPIPLKPCEEVHW